jgi:hypothetical protein
VLIYGDSSALVGVDPAIVRQRTGLTVCNIAELAGMTVVNKTLVLDLFLQRNPRPRFLVLLFAPENFSIPSNWDHSHVSTFEAISFRLEHERNLKTGQLLAAHPADAFSWAELGLRMALQRLRAKPFPYPEAHLREAHNGQLPDSGPVPAGCSSNLYTNPPDPAWIGRLRSQYGVGGTAVLIDATPAPECDPNLPFYRQHLDGLVDNAPYQPIPLSSFADNGRLHVNQSGASLISNMVAGQIVARLNGAAQPGLANGIGGR